MADGQFFWIVFCFVLFFHNWHLSRALVFTHFFHLFKLIFPYSFCFSLCRWPSFHRLFFFPGGNVHCRFCVPALDFMLPKCTVLLFSRCATWWNEGLWRLTFFFVPQNHCRGFCWLNPSVKFSQCKTLYSSWYKPSFVYSPVLVVYFKSHELAWTLHQKLRQHRSSPGLQNLCHLSIISVCDFKVTWTLILGAAQVCE